MRKIWDKIVAFISKVPYDKLLHFIVGLIASGAFAVLFGMKLCIIPAIFLGFAKEVFDLATTHKADWFDLLATVCGGLVFQILMLF